MLDASQIRAERAYDLAACNALPSRLAIDANVLYFVHYPNFATLAGLGGEAPAVAKTSRYGAAYKRALATGVTLITSEVTYYEFIHLVEKVEIETAWRTSGGRGSFDYKMAREQLHASLQTLRREVLELVTPAKKSIRFMEGGKGVDEALKQWVAASGDVSDSVLVARSLSHGVADFLSDDADLLTYSGVRLYTANQAALALAKTTGRLA